jgi:oligopeptidase B
MFAYSADLKGEERYSISVKNLDSGKTDSNVVNDAIGAIVWDRNSKGFFYVKLNDQRRSTKVYYHELGKSESQDRLVYKEEDETFPVNIRKTSDNKYLIINSYSNEGNEIRILNIENEKLFVPKVLIIRRTGQFYDIDHGHESFYLKINDKGKNFRLVKLKGEKFNKDNAAIELIPHKEKQYIGGFSLSKDYLVVNVRTNGVNNIIVLDKYGESKEIKFNEDAYNAYGYYPTYKSEFVRISYESFITPPSILEYDFSKNKIYTRKEKKVLGGYNKEQYKSEKIYINAGDGTKVPVSLFYRKDLFKKDGTNPLLLYGYGSYGISQYPSFNTGIFSLIDRGFVYAIAHIRGGSELGFKWYEGAKLLNKKRTFLDYINCAEELIKKKYADPKRIVGYGVSAGGMLLGYVINERPELLRAVVTDVPFVDVLNFLLDDTLPTTPFHFKELGNPKEKKYYDYIKSYSPYDNIKLQRYPAIYATAGLQDRRVAYWQPVKWIAKLREHNQSNNPVLLCIDMTSGHFGKSGRYDDLKKRVLMYNFILLNTGISLDQKQPF